MNHRTNSTTTPPHPQNSTQPPRVPQCIPSRATRPTTHPNQILTATPNPSHFLHSLPQNLVQQTFNPQFTPPQHRNNTSLTITPPNTTKLSNKTMSGATLAVDTSEKPAMSQPKQSQLQQTAASGGVMGSLRIIELQLVAFIMVFSASGLVPLLDLAFPAFTTLYVAALARLAFPQTGSAGSAAKDQALFQGSSFFRAYVVLGTTVGLFLPLAYVLGGFARGDDHAVRSATPHLFLLSCQILTENIISGLGLFSPPVRAMVPLLYTVRRIFVIGDWIFDVWFNKTLPADAAIKDEAWLWFGRSLAIANLLYFSTNLLGFLIPRFLPRAFERYFNERDEMQSKIAEDKQSRKELASPKASKKEE